MPRIDQRLIDKLVPGGQMFLVVGSAPSIDARTMDARIIRRTGDSNWQSTSLFETNLPPLVNATPPPGFLF
jgi:protein-L-isoaspartate O-methyltransferase